MGLFGSIKRAVTGPFRAIGKLAKGDLRGAGGALGDVIKPASFVLGATGVGAPIAAGVGALGGAMQKLDDPGAKFRDYLGGAAQGATVGLAGGAARGLAQNIGSRIAGAGAGAGGPTGAMAGPAGMPTPAMAEMPGVVARTVPQIGAETLASQGVSAASKPGLLANVGKFAAKNPELTVGGLQTAVGTYGAAEEGAARDREIKLQEEEAQRREAERQRRFKLDQIGQFINMMGTMRPRY
mgnify:CR=1 FL=1